MSRKKIGIVVDNLYNYQWSILEGVFLAGENYNLDILCFTGKHLNTPNENDKKGNLIYNLISKKNVDGLIIFSSAICPYITHNELVNFCYNYSKDVPTISIGTTIEKIPSIIIDNILGFKELLVHLIEDHGYKKFAFITGPLNNEEAKIRYETFINVLNEYEISINPQNIYYGDFLYNSGREAVKTFLDERKIDMEVIVSSNDEMAIGAIEELKERGILVPEDIKVTGFDDTEGAKFITPPLTTVSQPLYEMGWKSVESLVKLLSGEKILDQIFLPTKLIIRDSCGCIYSAIEKAKIDIDKEFTKLDYINLENLKDKFTEYLLRNLPQIDSKTLERIEKLYYAFIENLKERSFNIFISTLNWILKEEEQEGKNTGIFQDCISLLRKFLFYYLDDKTLHYAENIWHQARVIISDFSERFQGYRSYKTEQRVNFLTQIGISLTSSFEKKEILEQAKNSIINLGIRSFYIVEYKDSKPPLKEGLLVLGYKDGKEIKTNEPFDIYQIIPEKFLPSYRATYIVSPLFYKENSIGYSLFEVGPSEGIVYELLRAQLSAALQGAIIFKEREEYEKRLESHIKELSILNEIGKKITSALEVELLWDLIIKEISKLTDFDALYIINCKHEDDNCSFEIVAKKINTKEGDQLTTNDRKRILKIIETKKYLLKKSKNKKNKVFLGIPITIGDRIIGVIILKHHQVDVYNEHTVSLLSTLSSFIAIALENAKLFEETKKLATTDPLTGILNRRALEEAFQKEVMRAQRYNRPLSVMILDIDNFKLFNDTYGHTFGDEVLKTVASILKKSCRRVDILGRYGGDEFSIILPETPIEGAKKLAERIINNLKNTPILTPQNNKIPLNISIGIASYPFDTLEPEKLLTLADTAMYKAKTSGGGRFALLSSSDITPLKEEVPKFDIFLGLVNAIDNKDNYTFTHSLDVSKYAKKIGEKLGLSKEDLEILEIAGKLHDIGKIGIPSEILKKPGPLTEEEWKIIKEHPRLGYLILNQLPKMEKLLQAVLYHHERYDGKGYPQSLQGKDIPLLARILAVVDAYSAMKSDRPYRKALSKKEIIKEIKKNAGRQFDPEIAEIFVDLLEKGEID